ncbi:MAG: hypothetical protein ND866_30425 [Pyrinomonadaceae bacterium]|nr:hypothetical protein [Pyrinomonadaceae bacterium]
MTRIISSYVLTYCTGNAVGTTYLRASLLPDAHQAPLSKISYVATWIYG